MNNQLFFGKPINHQIERLGSLDPCLSICRVLVALQAATGKMIEAVISVNTIDHENAKHTDHNDG
jgi:hypothetical protein